MLIWSFQNANGENKKHKNIGEFSDFRVGKNMQFEESMECIAANL